MHFGQTNFPASLERKISSLVFFMVSYKVNLLLPGLRPGSDFLNFGLPALISIPGAVSLENYVPGKRLTVVFI